MRLPTLGFVVSSAQRAAVRFPLVLVSGVLAAGAGIASLDHASDREAPTRLMVAATLGLPLFFALTLVGERRVSTLARRWALHGAGVAALLAFWAAWPQWSVPVQAARYAQLSAAFHFMVAFLPYVADDEPSGFWHYNRQLFLRFLTAALYAGVLFVGLAIALLALDKLFGVPIPSVSYARLWIVISFVFNPWFFVAGAPADLPALERRTDYPTGLRIFTQYILLPIVVIYLLILTAYLGKVIMTREWPRGWIGYLVSSVATAGILAWLLVRPLEDQPEHRWVKTYTRDFYVALMPSIVMLWLAIGKRVGEYGITERRYFLIVLSLWLAGITVYYTFWRSRSIKVIPMTLCALALVTFAGPWGAYRVSERSQTGRLARVMARNDLWSNGVVRRATREVSLEDRREMSSMLLYLLRTHGTVNLASGLGDSLPGSARDGGFRGYDRAESRARAIMSNLGLAYTGPSFGGASAEVFSYYAGANDVAIPIAGYTHALRFSSHVVSDSIAIAEQTFLRYAADSAALRITRDGRVVLEVPLRSALAEVRAAQPVSNRAFPRPPLHAEASNERAAAVVYISSVWGRMTRGVATVSTLEGELLFRLAR